MKKKIIILFPYKFTNFDLYKWEIDKLNYYKIIDLSFTNNKYSKAWKTPRYKKM